MTDEVDRPPGVTARRRLDSAPTAPVLALDFGGTRTRAAVVEGDGTIGTRASAPTPLEAGSVGSVALFHELLRRVAAEWRERGGETPIAIGISAPGPLDPRRGVLFDPPNLPDDFHDLPLADLVGAPFGIPTFLERDTHLAALGEWSFGAARGLTDFIYLTVSTGLGGAVVTGGRLMTGPDGVAGELGHIPIDLDGPECGCGARGHLEAICSGTGIARDARVELDEGRMDPASILAVRATRAATGRLEAVDVAAAEEAGDPVAAEIMEHARRAFAAAMVGLVDVFDPERIVVGGSVARGQGERWLAPARAEVARLAFRVPRRRVAIVPAELGDDVSLVGALPLVRRALSATADRPDFDPASHRIERVVPTR